MPNPDRVLAFVSTPRTVGLVVLQRGDLIYHGAKTFPASFSPYERLKEIRRMVLLACRHLKPQTVVIGRHQKGRHDPIEAVAEDEVRLLVKRQGAHVMRLSLAAVSRALNGPHAESGNLMSYLLRHYPDLRREMFASRASRHERTTLFHAVATGLVATRRLRYR